MDNLHYREQGTGGPIVILIHGFPMNLQVWDTFAEKLSETCRVVTPDLPGFGKSPLLEEGFTLEEVASTVYEWMKSRNYVQPVVVGHSLGGYVALAMAERDMNCMAGMCLFHSTALADSEEKKESRNKVLEFIDSKGVQAFTSNFIGQLYADPQHSSVPLVKSIAVKSSREAVAGYTRAMRDRKERLSVLKNFPKPILLLAGEKDGGIPVDTVLHQASLNPKAEADILPEVAHMGMFEAEGTCLKKIQKFILNCPVTS